MSNGRGIIRKLDDLGRVVIPKEIRKLYNMERGTPIEIISLENNQGITIKPVIEGCELCGLNDEKEVITLNDHKLCRTCLHSFNAEAAKTLAPPNT